MKNSKKNILKNKAFIRSIIDNMIPASSDKILPKASEAINLNKFLFQLYLNKDLKKKLDKIIYNFKDKNLENSELGKIIAKSKQIENDVGEILIQLYFSSRIVKKQLNKKLSKNYSKKRYKNKDYSRLLKLVKKSSSRYKHT
tara:strand:- start:9758 stop:10183 length:426 start_codon:yes stop_codon:yes gene_type:complete